MGMATKGWWRENWSGFMSLAFVVLFLAGFTWFVIYDYSKQKHEKIIACEEAAKVLSNGSFKYIDSVCLIEKDGNIVEIK